VSDSQKPNIQKSPGTLVLVRHGQSQWNLENRFTGWVDVELTDLGREEARKAGEHLKGMPFSHAYTSHLRRAQETLRIILETGGLGTVPVTTSSALNERHYGDLQGLNKDETAKKYGAEQVLIWRRSYDVNPPGGESLKTTAERVLPYFEGNILPSILEGENILVVAHGNSLRAIVMVIEKLTPREILEVNIPTAVPLLYEFLLAPPAPPSSTIPLTVRTKKVLA
jgi:2,3-bisphosphoglycerate-dependent phosphoglycerate mutase